MKPVSDLETSISITHGIDVLSHENEVLTRLSERMRYLRKIPHAVEAVASECSGFGGVLEKTVNKITFMNHIQKLTSFPHH